MSTPVTEYATVTVSIQDLLIQQAGFGVPLIVNEFTLPSSWETGQRTKAYANIAAVVLDFATTTKVYKAASAVFSGTRAPTSIKVGIVLSGDANITAGLDAIEAYDPDWYCLVAAYRTEADLNEIAAWVEAAALHIAVLSSEDSGVLDSGSTTDIAADLQAASYNKTSYLWHHESGVDVVSSAMYVVASLVITITETAHGLRVGDTITFENAAGTPNIDGNNTVATVPDANTFTCVTTGADLVTPAAVDYFARYKFPDARWVGQMLPTLPGAETWAFQQLSGQAFAPLTLLSLTQQRTVRGKNANIYTDIGGVGATQEGQMASGRFNDTQRGIDWIGTRVAEAISSRLVNSGKVPFTDAGTSILRGDIAAVLQQGVNQGLLGPLIDSVSGELWRIFIPAVADVSTADRTARSLTNVTVTVRFAGAIHNVAIDVAVSL